MGDSAKNKMESPFTEAYTRIVDEQLKKWKLPGCSISVVHNDQTWTKGFGLADVEAKKPVEEDTLFWSGSTTKAMLCAAWSVYINSDENQKKPEKDRMGWRTSLAEIIRDDFVLPDSVQTGQVTLEDVLCMRSGMARHDGAYGWGEVKDVRAVTRNLRNLPIHNPVRQEWEYCNSGYAAATHALETLTGKAFADIMKEWLWGPLGMDSTFGGYKGMQKGGAQERMATGYLWSRFPCDEDFEEGKMERKQQMDLDVVSGAGWVISTARDYAKWTGSLLQAARDEGKKGPLTNTQVLDLIKPRSSAPHAKLSITPLEGEHVQYAMGWFVGVYKGRKVVYHPGGLVGFGSLVLLCPEENFAATFLCNGMFAGFRLNGLLYELLDAAMGIPESERTGLKKSVSAVGEAYSKMFPPREERLAKLFPQAPSRAGIPPSFPVEEYAGTYSNTGYGSLTFTTSKKGDFLECKVEDHTWPLKAELKHINAEYWLFELVIGNREMRKAESKIGVDGKVEALGIAMEDGMPDTLIWYQRR